MTERRGFEEVYWVSEEDWPFEDGFEGLKQANVLVPDDMEWVASQKIERGYYLLQRVDR